MKKVVSKKIKNMVTGSLVAGTFLALSSCGGGEGTDTVVDDVVEGTDGVVEEITEEVEEVIQEADSVASDIEAMCGEGKCGEGKCGEGSCGGEE